MTDDLRVVIDADADPLVREFKRAGVETRAFGSAVSRTTPSARAFSAAVDKQKESLRGLRTFAGHAAFAIGTGLAIAFASAVKVGMDFESQMARVQAVTGATGKEMDELRKLAIQLGADTKFSAGEAAEAMYELASAGFNVAETKKTLPGTLSLAAASSIDLASAAEISSNALRGFGLQSKESTHVADVLAKSVNSSSVEMEDLQLSLKYIGPVARVTGESFESMIGAVSLMGDAGIKGEQAGTSLRGGLLRLVKPTKQVEEGLKLVGVSAEELQGPNGLLPLPELVGKLQQGMEGLSKAEQAHALASIFGNEALSGMLTVVDAGPAKLRALTDEFEHSNGASAKAAKTMNDTVKGSFEQLKGSVETVEIELFTHFQEPLKHALLDATDIVNTEGKHLQDALDEVMSSPEFDQADFAGKFDMLAGAVTDEWSRSGLGDKLVEGGIAAFNFALPRIASAAGHGAITVAEAFVKGFMDSDALGKLAIGGWLISKFGGFAALRASGGLLATKVAEGAATSTVAGGVAGGAARSGIRTEIEGVASGAAGGAAAQAGWRGALGRFGIQLTPAGEAVLPVAVTFAAAVGAHKGLQEVLGDKQGDIASKGTSSTSGLGSGPEQIEALVEAFNPKHEKFGDFTNIIDKDFKEAMARINLDQLSGLQKLNSDLSQGLQVASQTWQTGTKPWREHVVDAMRQTVHSIKMGMASGSIQAEDGRKAIQHILGEIKLVEGTDPLGLAAGVVSSFKKAGGVTQSGIDGLIRDFGQMPKGAREKGQDAVLEMANAWAKGHPKIEHQVDVLRENLEHKFGRTNKSINHSIEKLSEGVSFTFEDLAGKVDLSLEDIGGSVDFMLRKLSIQDTINFSVSHGNFSAAGIGPKPREKQDGGFIVPGTGDGDSFPMTGQHGAFVLNREAAKAYGFNKGGAVPLMLEPGEAYIGPEATNRIGVHNLERMNNEVPRKLRDGGDVSGRKHVGWGKGHGHFHSGDHGTAGVRGRIPRPIITGPEKLAELGQAGSDKVWRAAQAYLEKHMPAAGVGVHGSVKDHPELQPGISAIVATILKRWPALAISSTTGGGHAENSLHYEGRAADLAGATGYMLDAAGWIKANLTPALTEGIHNPNLSVKYGKAVAPGFWGSAVWADHLDHIHVGKQLGGLVLAMASGGLVDLVGGNFDINEAATLAMVAGAKNPGLMGAITKPESGGDPNATNSSGAEGLWQILGHPDLVAKYGEMTDPWNNAEAMRDLSNESGTAPWAASASGWAGAPKGSVDAHLAAQMREVIGGKAGASGLTSAQKKKAEAKARKEQREDRLEKLRAAVAAAKTDPAKQSALWRLLSFWGRVGVFDKDERQHILDAVQNASSQTNTTGRIKILSHLASYARTHGEITGEEPKDGHSLEDAISKAQERGQKERERTVEKHKRQRDRKKARIEARGEFKGLADMLEGHEKSFGGASQLAERLVALEPEELTDGYVGQERGAWTVALDELAGWRDKTVYARNTASTKIELFQGEIDKIKELKGDAFQKQKWRIQPLREAIANAQAFVAERRTDLEGFQGIGGPQTMLGSLGEDTPWWLTLGGPGASVFDTQNTIRELGLKDIGGSGADTSAWTAAKEAMATRLAQEFAVSQGETRVLGEFFRELGDGIPYLGAYAQGTGGLRIGRTGLAMLHRDEQVVPDPKGPAGSQLLAPAAGDSTPQITLVLKDRAVELVDLIDARVDGKVAKVDRQLGIEGRRRAVSPGRA